MCNPLAAGIGLLVAGAGAQMHGQRQAARATDRNVSSAMATERRRQERLSEEQRELLSQMVNEDSGREGIEREQNAARDKRREMMQQAFDSNRPGGDAAPTTGERTNATPRVVQTDMARRREEGEAETANWADGLAQLSAFGDGLSNIQRDRQPLASRLGMSQGFGRRSSGILPQEIQAARMRGQQRGGLARTLGSVATAAGAGMLGPAGYAAGAGGAGAGAASAADVFRVSGGALSGASGLPPGINPYR